VNGFPVRYLPWFACAYPWCLLKGSLSVTSPSAVFRHSDFEDPAKSSAESATHSSPAVMAPETAIDLRVIATSDLHASLLPYDYCANRAVSGRSLSEISRQIATARAQVPNSLLFDNGDFLQGTPLADFVASRLRRRRVHPVIAAFNTLGYDAVTLGNHEFNYGVPFLSSALTDARFPVVSANIVTRLARARCGTRPSCRPMRSSSARLWTAPVARTTCGSE
jgi:2',3'-cyclic-nucleotide 2'-phosphodiesterase (5'-nucleotidase family)